jgi:hypothetical protein
VLCPTSSGFVRVGIELRDLGADSVAEPGHDIWLTPSSSEAVSIAGQICTEEADNPSSADVASASALVTSAIAAASSTSSGRASSVMPFVGAGLFGGGAALAAYAL